MLDMSSNTEDEDSLRKIVEQNCGGKKVPILKKRYAKVVEKSQTQKSVSQSKSDHETPKNQKKQRAKRIIDKCAHVDRPYYAKGMCNHCYHAYGRTSLASNCPH